MFFQLFIGFYWDITDWVGGHSNDANHHLNETETEIQINKSLNLSTNSPYSPIYSKVFKGKLITIEKSNIPNKLLSSLFLLCFFKVISNKDKMETFEDLMQDLKQLPVSTNYDELNYHDEDGDANNLEGCKFDLLKLRKNYMYLVNREDECDKTFESETNN